MAKAQFILAVHDDYLADHSIESGFNKYKYKKFLNDTQRYLAIRQRDYLDGIGVNELASYLEKKGVSNYKGVANITDDSIVTDTETLKFTDNPIGVWYTDSHGSLVTIMEDELYIYNPDKFDRIDRVVNGDTDYRQLLPYTVFKVVGENKFFTYRRTKKVGESRLAGNCSIGFGGHIDLADVVFDKETSVIDLETTITDASLRELNEEVQISDTLHDLVVNENLEPTKFGLLNDTSDHVGSLHLGIVNIYEVSEDDIQGVAEDELEFMGALTIEEILENNPESWTRLIVEKYL